ncbi:hypothetical protein GH714_000200 [Hevea brasiliensis]|uniref:Ribosomal protein L30 N-terminal domain-containing protein n=1 Tax=Hevea brasiliensis TaxID=3981 RepID=A0A6A6NAJ2_HEVBR|nr:hypothetical protein GH714_000200 [Hevea brasiliensis]
MAEGETMAMAYIPEVILKKRKHKEESLALTRKTQLEFGKYGGKKRKVEDIKRPEQFIKEFRDKALGKHGILCLEDIVHEIANVGPHFKEITNFLGPFALSKPKGGLQGKRASYKDGGDTGNREDEINDLIDKMN